MEQFISNFVELNLSSDSHLDFSKTLEFQSFIYYRTSDNRPALSTFGIITKEMLVEWSQILGLGNLFIESLNKIKKYTDADFASIFSGYVREIYHIIFLYDENKSFSEYLCNGIYELIKKYKDTLAINEDATNIIFNFIKELLFRLDEYSFRSTIKDGKLF